MVDITLLELRFDEVEFEGSATAALPFGSATTDDTDEDDEESVLETGTEGDSGARSDATEREDSAGGGRGKLLALVGAVLALVGLAIALNRLRGDDPEVAIRTAGEQDNGDRPVGVTVED
jgi:hypothetical protein